MLFEDYVEASALTKQDQFFQPQAHSLRRYNTFSIRSYHILSVSSWRFSSIRSLLRFFFFNFRMMRLLDLRCKQNLRSYGSTCRAMASLTEKHKTFLDIVRTQGSGSVKLKYDHSKRIATLSFANQSVRNAISGRMMFQLAEALDDLIDDGSKRYRDVQKRRSETNESNDNILAVIIRSPGIVFSSGADLSLVTEIGK